MSTIDDGKLQGTHLGINDSQYYSAASSSAFMGLKLGDI
jgi:hypothetical protein